MNPKVYWYIKTREGREEGKVLYSRMPANIEKLTEFKNHYFVTTDSNNIWIITISEC